MPRIVRVIVYDYQDANIAKQDMQHWNLSPLGTMNTKNITISSHITAIEGSMLCPKCGELTDHLRLSLLCNDCVKWIDKQKEVIHATTA